MKSPNFVASAITRSHPCRPLHLGKSEGLGYTERALEFGSSGCDSNTTHAWEFFSVPGILVGMQLRHASKLTEIILALF
jgi:hypothetical protein